ncbi:Hpt domain-containing protein, partial [Accumulibacter sp.]|uniref:Hpt domain-containing protein n=1 Tax=Accumulibacter sp. TaxID=2053492 RepID=UPI001AC6EDB5
LNLLDGVGAKLLGVDRISGLHGFPERLDVDLLDHPIRQLPGPNGELLVQKVVAAYLGDAPTRLAQLQAAAAAGDAEALRRAAHALKSSSANVGAEPLAALCKELEALGRQGDVDGAGTLLAAAEAELMRVLATLNSTFLANAAETPGRVVDTAKTVAL